MNFRKLARATPREWQLVKNKYNVAAVVGEKFGTNSIQNELILNTEG